MSVSTRAILKVIPIGPTQVYFGWMNVLGSKVTPQDCHAMAIALMDGADDSDALVLLREKRAGEHVAALASACRDVVQSAWVSAAARKPPEADIRDSPDTPLLRAWFAHYRLVALRSQGLSESGVLLSLEAERRIGSFPHLLDEETLDYARRDMRLGHYVSAVERLESHFVSRSGSKLNSPPALGFLFSTFLTWGTCLQAMGRFPEADDIRERLRRIERIVPARYLKILSLRREGSLLVEAERVEEASEFFPRNAPHFLTSNFPNYPIQTILFLQDWLRFALTAGDDAAIEDLFGRITAHVETLGLSRAFLNMDEERCRYELRKRGSVVKLMERFETLVERNRKSGDEAAACVVSRLLAHLHLRRGSLERAHGLALESIELAERLRFGKARVEGTVLLACVTARRGMQLEAETLLQKGHELATSLGLDAFAHCIECVGEALQAGAPQLTSLVRLRRFVGALERTRLLLVDVGLDALPLLRAQFASGREEMGALWEVLAKVLGPGTIVFLPSEKKALVPSELGLSELLLPPERSALLQAFFRGGSEGLTLSEIHSVAYPHVAFVALRHRDRAAASVARLRSCFPAKEGFIKYDTQRDAYILGSTSGLVMISDFEPQTGRISKGGHLTPREREILSLIHAAGRMRTETLTARLGCSRQSLHAFLSSLCEAGLIRREGKGRSTSFVSASRFELS